MCETFFNFFSFEALNEFAKNFLGSVWTLTNSTECGRYQSKQTTLEAVVNNNFKNFVEMWSLMFTYQWVVNKKYKSGIIANKFKWTLSLKTWFQSNIIYNIIEG